MTAVGDGSALNVGGDVSWLRDFVSLRDDRTKLPSGVSLSRSKPSSCVVVGTVGSTTDGCMSLITHLIGMSCEDPFDVRLRGLGTSATAMGKGSAGFSADLMDVPLLFTEI